MARRFNFFPSFFLFLKGEVKNVISKHKCINIASYEEMFGVFVK
jgi:hypothetical protein